jgi:Ca-activated chloride channel family protein
MPINPKLLEELASMTGGEAFRATDKAELDARLVAVLDRLDRSKLQAPRELRPYLELFPWCVGAGLALLALELVLSSTRLWRFP